jgi:hypothetical protein
MGKDSFGQKALREMFKYLVSLRGRADWRGKQRVKW